MNPSEVLLLALLIGAVSGLRSFTAPATVAWGAHLKWLNLHYTRLAFMGSTASVVIFTLLAVFELIMDKLPSTPSRLKPRGMFARIILGALSGACLAAAGMQSIALATVLGAVGAVAGAFAGYALRTGLVKALKVPDFVIAVLGDALAIAAGLLIASRF
ncbi:MAG: DUF4126 family protein [Candidatus Acidiferrales bacterium]